MTARQFTRRYDLAGHSFGKLTAVRFITGGKWLCTCECGNEVETWTTSLVSGGTKSCGCAWHATSAVKTHGRTETPEYKVWCGIKRRCYNQNEKSYSDYGGRGICMCDRWLNSFAAFLEDMGERPSAHHQIDRIDNDGHYCKENCQWATRVRQCRNRRTSRIIEHNGESMTVAEWAEVLGIAQANIRYRLRAGWSVADALKA